MPIIIRDSDLERKIDRERERRGDLSKTKTAKTMLVERLTQISSEPQSPPAAEHVESKD